MDSDYIIEMLHITKEFPGIVANDDITLQLRRGEIHALLGENGAGKSTLMSVLFGLYQPEAGVIKKNGEVVRIDDPNDATALDAARVASDIVLMGQDLAPVAGAIDLAGQARRRIKENFAISIAYNLVAVPFAIMGLATPLMAALAMSISSISVTLNALRLR